MARQKTLKKEERQQVLLERLADPEEEHPTMEDLLEHIGGELCEKTIRRDMDAFRKMGASICCRRDGGGEYRYVLEGDFRLPHAFSAEDMLHFMILKKALGESPGSFLDTQIGSLAHKMSAITIEQRDVSNHQIDQAVSFKPPPIRGVSSDLWKLLFEAVIKRRTVDVVYSPGSGEPQTLQLRPYHLACLEWEWYLLAGSSRHPEPRQYSIAEFKSAVAIPGKNHFEPPADLDPQKMLLSTFGRFVGSGPMVLVRVRVTGLMVKYVRDRLFHAQQEIVESEDGKSVEIAFPVSASGPVPFGNVTSWILSMGPYAQVLEPPELIQKVKSEAAQIFSRYNDA